MGRLLAHASQIQLARDSLAKASALARKWSCALGESAEDFPGKLELLKDFDQMLSLLVSSESVVHHLSEACGLSDAGHSAAVGYAPPKLLTPQELSREGTPKPAAGPATLLGTHLAGGSAGSDRARSPLVKGPDGDNDDQFWEKQASTAGSVLDELASRRRGQAAAPHSNAATGGHSTPAALEDADYSRQVLTLARIAGANLNEFPSNQLAKLASPLLSAGIQRSPEMEKEELNFWLLHERRRSSAADGQTDLAVQAEADAAAAAAILKEALASTHSDNKPGLVNTSGFPEESSATMQNVIQEQNPETVLSTPSSAPDAYWDMYG